MSDPRRRTSNLLRLGCYAVPLDFAPNSREAMAPPLCRDLHVSFSHVPIPMDIKSDPLNVADRSFSTYEAGGMSELALTA